MNKLNIIQNENGNEAVLCSQLYSKLGLQTTNYKKWINRNIKNSLFAIEGVDYTPLPYPKDNPPQTINARETDFVLSLEFAKCLAMMCRNKTGQEIRKYFLECEKVAKTKTNAYLIELQTELNAWRRLECIRLERIELNRQVRELKTSTAKPSKKNFTDFTNQLTLNFN